ncbi:DUF6177 family protein [Nocardiopsis sp. NPDC058631]|uniref:DUF6177 family protein n=1 Tax=Nocardiopsis sp. NPDC058631 TaxID=3346566 RepID=UPI00364A20CF
MSYDVVALVAHKPDDQAIARALQDVDPELRLHQHKDTSVLQIRDQDGHLLATLEPGQQVECRGEVDRLLGPEVAAGLPDSCWWVETRARPDQAGRQVAHRFSDGLALRLGGAVWTSGEADFGLWREPEHPAVERTATRALLVAQDRAVVGFSSWLSDAVATHAGQKALQVLTPPTARLTYGARTFLAGPLGRWVVRGEDGGHYDGLTGLAVHWDDTYGFCADKEPAGLDWAAKEPGAQPVAGFLANFAESAGTQLVVEVSVLHHDPHTPRLGRVVEVLAEHLAGPEPAGWGPHEPVLRMWDPEELSAFARQRAPKPSICYVAGPLGVGHPFSGQMRLTWRTEGVLERVSVVIGFGDEHTVPFESLPTVVEALAAEGLMDGLRVRRTPGRSDVTYGPVWAGPAVPVGIAIGPERLQTIGISRAQAGPIKGTLLGQGEAQAVWYPVLGSAASPLKSLGLVQRQTSYLASAGRS